MPCNLLVQELLSAKRELSLPRLLKRWANYDALLLDDIGYVQPSREEMEVLFALLAHRYERGSVMMYVSWNRSEAKYGQITCMRNLKSYRLEHSQTRTQQLIPAYAGINLKRESA